MRKFGGREVSLLVVLTVMEGGQRGGLSKKKKSANLRRDKIRERF